MDEINVDLGTFSIATQKAFILEQIRLNIDTDASGSSPQSPVVVNVELFPRNDFRNAASLGIVFPPPRTSGLGVGCLYRA